MLSRAVAPVVIVTRSARRAWLRVEWGRASFSHRTGWASHTAQSSADSQLGGSREAHRDHLADCAIEERKRVIRPLPPLLEGL